MYATPDELARDRELLRQRWYAEGWYSDRTMADEMRAGAERYPDVEMIFHSDEHPGRATLSEMYDRATVVAANLQRYGVGPGDVVAIQVPSWLEGAIAFEAAMLTGAVIVPIIHIYGAAEMSFILRQSRATTLIVPDRWRNIDYLERLAGLRDVPDLHQTVVIGERLPAGATAWDELATDRGAVFELPDFTSDDVCLLVYTSGTTADPKGVQHTHNSLLADVRSVNSLFDYHEHVSMGMFPFGHIAGALSLGRLFVYGTKTIMIDRWDAAEAAALVERHGVQSSAGAPFHLQTLLDAAEADRRDISTLRRIATGAASVPPSLVERWDQRGVSVVRQYGSSEHPTVTSGLELDSIYRRSQTDGRAIDGNELRIVDENGKDVAVGEDGEIATRGPEQFVGYRDSTLDETSFLPGGWFLTGDVGRVATDGYLTITDRKKDVIIRGGENISSKEVEDALARHPDVVEVAVVAMPDERYGERVCAYAILRPDATVDLDALIRHFSELGIAKQKTPERLEIVDELPRTPSGKVKKYELRQRLREEIQV